MQMSVTITEIRETLVTDTSTGDVNLVTEVVELDVGITIGEPGPPGPKGDQGIPGPAAGQIGSVFTYDDQGRLEILTDITGTKTFIYDSNSRLIGITGTGSYVSRVFNYDLSGKLLSVEVV